MEVYMNKNYDNINESIEIIYNRIFKNISKIRNLSSYIELDSFDIRILDLETELKLVLNIDSGYNSEIELTSILIGSNNDEKIERDIKSNILIYKLSEMTLSINISIGSQYKIGDVYKYLFNNLDKSHLLYELNNKYEKIIEDYKKYVNMIYNDIRSNPPKLIKKYVWMVYYIFNSHSIISFNRLYQMIINDESYKGKLLEFMKNTKVMELSYEANDFNIHELMNNINNDNEYINIIDRYDNIYTSQFLILDILFELFTDEEDKMNNLLESNEFNNHLNFLVEGEISMGVNLKKFKEKCLGYSSSDVYTFFKSVERSLINMGELNIIKLNRLYHISKGDQLKSAISLPIWETHIKRAEQEHKADKIINRDGLTWLNESDYILFN